MTANELTQAILKYLNAQPNTLAWRNVANRVKGRRFTGKKGVGDIIAVHKGRHVEVEVKVGADQMRPEQIEHCAAVENAGGVYLVARDWDEFMQDWARKMLS